MVFKTELGHYIKIMWIQISLLFTTVLATPSCFYCSTQIGKQEQMSHVSYTGLVLNLEEECQDICEYQQFELTKQSDCQHWTGQDTYYAFDERVQTCFSFDPRDQDKLALSRFQNSGSRELATVKCSDVSDCFTCEGTSAGLCSWNGNRCSDNSNRDALTLNWYNSYQRCPDYLGLCSTTSQNTTFF